MQIEGRLVETGDGVRLTVEGTAITAMQSIETRTETWIAPGFIDIQVNGYAGLDFNAADVTPETVAGVVRALWRRGVSAICPTVITQSEAAMCRSLSAIAAACDADPRIAHAIPCIHVEGPFISSEDGPRGAHPLVHVRPPSIAEYQRWQEASGGRVGIVTLAPEYPDAPVFIRAIAGDVVVALGHTAADAAQIRAAVDAGARLSTHLGNGAHGRLARHPNYIWEQLADDRLAASLICDGHHLPPAVIKAMVRAKGLERTILVSDAVAVAGLPPGVYDAAVGGKVELLPSGRLNLFGTPYLAGSASSLPEGIANAIRHADVTLAEAVRFATANPARLLRFDGARGRGAVRVGTMADLTLFRHDRTDDTITIMTTVVNGEIVYRRGG
ncbi:MAG: N-acetylglucosamine-6-phosphate deacetylase [Thermomicrobiales bacterium]